MSVELVDLSFCMTCVLATKWAIDSGEITGVIDGKIVHSLILTILVHYSGLGCQQDQDRLRQIEQMTVMTGTESWLV